MEYNGKEMPIKKITENVPQKGHVEYFITQLIRASRMSLKKVMWYITQLIRASRISPARLKKVMWYIRLNKGK